MSSLPDPTASAVPSAQPAASTDRIDSEVQGRIWTVILAGGVGSRFWPVSTPSRPKQLLPLASDRPLIEDTLQRILPLVPQERIRILTGAPLADPILATVPTLGPGNFLLEPRAAGTAPVLVWAAAELERRDPDAVMISLHADHVIDPPEAFRALLARAAALAIRHRRLFTIGAVPTRPETGYGYIRVGDALPGEQAGAAGQQPSAAEVAEFVEKPDVDTAARYVADGGYLWNTGLFVWRAADLLDQVERHTPELADLVPVVREGGVEEFFRRAPTLSIDEGLLERSDRVGVLRATFDWDDVGAWDAVARTRPADDAGNVAVGEAFAVDSRNTVLYADGGPIVAFGVDDLVVVRTGDVTFVTHRERTAELKSLLGRLPESLRNLG
jgi:mannose-1-phosphate guanylyltransferase